MVLVVIFVINFKLKDLRQGGIATFLLVPKKRREGMKFSDGISEWKSAMAKTSGKRTGTLHGSWLEGYKKHQSLKMFLLPKFSVK